MYALTYSNSPCKLVSKRAAIISNRRVPSVNYIIQVKTQKTKIVTKFFRTHKKLFCLSFACVYEKDIIKYSTMKGG